MTRFKKEMIKRYPEILESDDFSEVSVSVHAEGALIVFAHPSIIEVYRVCSNLELIDIGNEYIDITHPYLVHLCNGDIDKAKNIIK